MPRSLPMPDLDRPLADSDDDTIAAALELAVLPPLLAALAGDLGDLTLVPDHLRPDLSVFMDPTFGLSAAQVDEGQRAGPRRRCSGCASGPRSPCARSRSTSCRRCSPSSPAGPPATTTSSCCATSWRSGRTSAPPRGARRTLAPDRPFRVAVIGAGMSGLVAAHRLHQAGVEVVVLEKNDDVGGTWLENSYPGCRVDVSNLFYCYSFAQRDDWPQHFSTQEVLLDYFRGVADRFGLRPLIRFGTEVSSARSSTRRR